MILKIKSSYEKFSGAAPKNKPDKFITYFSDIKTSGYTLLYGVVADLEGLKELDDIRKMREELEPYSMLGYLNRLFFPKEASEPEGIFFEKIGPITFYCYRISEIFCEGEDRILKYREYRLSYIVRFMYIKYSAYYAGIEVFT